MQFLKCLETAFSLKFIWRKGQKKVQSEAETEGIIICALKMTYFPIISLLICPIYDSQGYLTLHSVRFPLQLCRKTKTIRLDEFLWETEHVCICELRQSAS